MSNMCMLARLSLLRGLCTPLIVPGRLSSKGFPPMFIIINARFAFGKCALYMLKVPFANKNIVERNRSIN